MPCSPIVLTASGTVRGRVLSTGTVFYGIPYAAPPQGTLRFAAPRPHPGWSGVRDATRPGPTAPQPKRDSFGSLDMSPYFGPGWVPGPDYLTVNIWTPTDRHTPRPVMVFIHGGGFVAGSGASPLYDGRAFSRDGVVLVTVNYRLGIPGFLHLDDAPDNRGMLDVLAALRWIQHNIAAFGGDADNVTLFGQSAGAILISSILADPAAQGLFRRAIVQSGSGTATSTPAQAQRLTDAAGEQLGLHPSAAALAPLPDDQLIALIPHLATVDLRIGDTFHPLGGITPFTPVLDRQPAATIASGHGVHTDLLIGTTAEEGNLYLAPVGHLTARTTNADLLAAAATLYPRPAELVDAYRAGRPDASAAELHSALVSDALFRNGTRQLACAHATAHGPSTTYVYDFTWRPDTLQGRLGAAHTIELPFVFDTTELPQLHGPRALLGETAPPRHLARQMHHTWIRFATTGDPGWTPYSPAQRTVMHIGLTWTAVTEP